MGFINNFITSKVSLTFEKEAASIVQICRSYGPLERIELKVCMLLVLATLAAEADQTGDETFFKILEAMESCKPLERDELPMLSIYTMKLIQMQKQAHLSSNKTVKLIASGIPVWIVSIRSLSHVAVLPYARQIWSILQNSDTLEVYDRIGELAGQLGQQKVADILLRIRSTFGTPSIFIPH